MPIHLPTLSRRRFLLGTAGAMAGLVSVRSLPAAAGSEVDPNSFALLSDTHVPSDPTTANGGVRMAEHCEKAVAQVLELDRRPAAVLINGDAAYLRGLPGDYELLNRCLKPLAEADVPVHVTMGNHDDRGPFYDVMRRMRPESPPLEGWHVGVLETEHVNWFMVDSLDEVNVTPGRLGEQQLAWLGRALDDRPDKPAIICGHHYPQWEQEQGNGLLDTEAFFDVLAEHDHVKAYFFGHSHRWEVTEHAGIKLINLPAVAYVFQESETSGWVHGRTTATGLELEFRALDRQHDYHGEQVRVDFS